ncbi:MAG: chorismate mutase [Candidatus Pelagibacter sp. TMED64]|nr:chorismate mutase [Candidatus Pelagibacter sp.]OUU64886.1 MAG: chorismate mutase [Candidatus Pelagibacter sp. TMED64]|tara:strand:+ start:5584 stop:5865 length:282 start_codon:yes stop_codon:yes gene_type:complete
MDKKKILIIRKKLDKIDNQLFILISKRTKIVKEIIKVKQYKNQIVDKKRINQILRKIKKKSISSKIDPKITLRIWKNMIWGYIGFERRNFKKK